MVPRPPSPFTRTYLTISEQIDQINFLFKSVYVWRVFDCTRKAKRKLALQACGGRERARKKSSESKTSVASTSKHYLLFMRAYIYHGGWHLTKHRRMKLSFRSKRNICARLLCYASVQLKTHENRHKSLWKNPISSFCVLRSTIASLALKFRFSRFAFRSTFLSSPSV